MKEYLMKMFVNPQKHVKIIALYWTMKGYKFVNMEQVDRAFIRDTRAARNLQGYTKEQILITMRYLINNTDLKWTLETVHKYIDDLHGTPKKKEVIKI